MHNFVLPDIGEGLVEAEIVQWMVEVGGTVGADDPLVEVETDKTVVVIPSPVSGTLVSQGAKAGETLAVGAVLASIDDGSSDPEPAPAEPAETEDLPLVGSFATDAETLVRRDASPASSSGVLALPLVRKLARTHEVDLNRVSGSGPDGRITRADVMAVVEGSQAEVGGSQPAAADDDSPATSPAPVSFSSGRVVPMSKLRKTIAERMSQSWAEVPRVTTFDEVNASRLIETRKALSLRHKVNVSLEVLVVKAVVPVLVEFPEFNAAVQDTNLIVYDNRHIGVAVDTSAGLIVPVLRDAETMSVVDMAAHVANLMKAAEDRSLAAEDLRGGTFTVSNIGAVGGGHGTPIVPPGTTAILSVGRAKDTPIAVDGKLVIAPMMPLSLSYDHRAIDGAVGRKFMARLMENLTEPALFLA